MLEKALELLNIFYEKGYESYIVGGFVRDYILGKKSCDVDICTNATPMEVKEIFNDVKLPFEGYGSVHLAYKKVNFEITTYRMDLEYLNKRSPSKIMYTDNLIIDLKRRDFTMNTICIDKDGNVIDLLNAKEDIKNSIIKCVGNSDKRLKEDALRILRAIRFSCELNFVLDEELKQAIINNKEGLNELSYYRKKQELNKIFSSSNALYGVSLIKEFALDEYLGININKRIIKTSDPIGIWAQIEPISEYQFTSNEKDYISSINKIVEKKEISDIDIYNEGNYVCFIAAQILGIDEVNIYDRYDNLPIKKTSDIALKPGEIIDILSLEDKSKIKLIIKDLELKIIDKKLKNDKAIIKEYIIDNYEVNMI